jgi:hypothetical protein
MEQSPSWELTGLQLVKKFPTFYGTRKFMTTFTRARHLSLSWASPIPYIPPQSTSWRSNLILSSHLHLVLPSWSPSLKFPHQNSVHASPLPHTHYMPRPSHFSWFYHPHNSRWGVQIINLSTRWGREVNTTPWPLYPRKYLVPII